jgi:23S rRNA (cytidine1920-2'-O)/16S rRNA (cytidine1409-2'-O)-methyltransferase
VLEEVCALADELGVGVAGLIPSPLLGPAGNVEFLIWLQRGPNQDIAPDRAQLIQAALDAAHTLAAQ